MRQLAITQPDIAYRISPVSLRTADGQTIVPLTEELLTSDPNVIAVIFGPGSSKSNPREFRIHVSGAVGLASLTYAARNPQGDIVRSCGEQFSVSIWTGTIVAGGELSEERITEENAEYRRNTPMHA